MTLKERLHYLNRIASDCEHTERILRKIVTKDGSYTVVFTHRRWYLATENECHDSVVSVDGTSVFGGRTNCVVTFTPKRRLRKLYKHEEVVLGSFARCSFEDVYDHRRGESLSLSRALQKIHPRDRDARVRFWEAWEEDERFL